MTRVLVTGASGFIGTAMCERLISAGTNVVAAVRREAAVIPPGASRVVTGDLAGTTSWKGALREVSQVIHLAARVHVMDSAGRAAEPYRRVNVEGTMALARQAAGAGVQRFVFVSSVKVNGERRDSPYSERDIADPHDAYGQSKWEAEQGLRDLERQSGMSVTIVRPPLVYGPGVRANFRKLMELVQRRIPLPLKSVQNRLSLIYVGNLVDALARCLVHPAAAGQTYLVSDGEDISTPDLVRSLATAMRVRPNLLPVPASLLRLAAKLVGKTDVIDRLIGSLTVDSRAIRTQLGWAPPVPLQQGLSATVADYLESHAG